MGGKREKVAICFNSLEERGLLIGEDPFRKSISPRKSRLNVNRPRFRHRKEGKLLDLFRGQVTREGSSS